MELQIYQDDVLGPKLLGELLVRPLTLLDKDLLEAWILKNERADVITQITHDKLSLKTWVALLTPIEKTIFYYTIAKFSYGKKYQKKKWGPGTPLIAGTASTGLAVSALAGGTVVGAVAGGAGGVIFTSNIAENIDNKALGVSWITLGGTCSTVGGAFLGGCAGAVAGGLVAIPLLGIAAKDYTYGVCKSIVLWPTAPLELSRANQLEAIRQALYEFSQLLDRNGDFNSKYSSVIEDGNHNLLGISLYSLYMDCCKMVEKNRGTDNYELIEFLACLKNIVMKGSLIPTGKIYRKIAHLKDMILLESGIPIKPFYKIYANAAESYVDQWISDWHAQYAQVKRKTENSDGTNKLAFPLSSTQKLLSALNQ